MINTGLVILNRAKFVQSNHNMKVSVIIVSWNVKNLLEKCLASIFKYTHDISFEVIVVDNNSYDNTVEMVNEKFPQVNLIANDSNAGFAKANNQGLERAQGEYVLFMNPDMEFHENTLKKMSDLKDERPDVFASTCQLQYPDGERQNNIKRLPGFISQFFILLKLHHFLSFLPAVSKYLYKDFDYSKEYDVENIMGAFVFARRSEFIELGAWNEKYWLWWEDVDLCKKAKNANKKIIYTPITKVTHYEGKSFEQVASPAKQKRFIRGMLTYFKSHHTFTEYFFLLIFSPVSIALAYIGHLLKIKPRPQSKV